MARKPNYSFEKNLKAKAKAEKREAKRLAKLAARAGDQTGEGQEPGDGDAPVEERGTEGDAARDDLDTRNG